MPKVAGRGSSLRIHLTTELFTHRRELSGRWVGGGGGGLLEGIRRQTDKVHIAWGTESEDFVRTAWEGLNFTGRERGASRRAPLWALLRCHQRVQLWALLRCHQSETRKENKTVSR